MTKKCEEPERRNFHGLYPLTREVRKIVKPILGKNGFVLIDVLENWYDIVGEELAVGVVPEKLSFLKDNRTNGTLHVKVAGGAFGTEVEYQKDRLIQKINTFFGYPAIKMIKIKQGNLKVRKKPVSKPEREVSVAEIEKVQERTKHIADPELRKMMVDIGVKLLKK